MDTMNFKKIKDQAQQVYERRGGAEAAKGDGRELKEIFRGPGSLAEKAKRAGEALKNPGAGTPPPAERPRQGP